GQAVAHLTFQAMSLGIYVHQMAGFDPEKVRVAYAVPERFDPITGIALGYLGDPDSLPDDLRTVELSPRQRKRVLDFVYAGKWGDTFSFIAK
ncbi:MAG: nitroreductase, partial [bacterium]